MNPSTVSQNTQTSRQQQTKQTATLRLHRHPLSGHSHRVELFLSLLGLEAELVTVDVTKGEQKEPAFLQKNSFGQVPVLEDVVDGAAVVVADSNAILVYLAMRFDAAGTWLPKDPRGAAAVQRWLSVAAGQLAFGPGAARLVTLFKAPFQPQEVIGRANALFTILEKHLTTSNFLVGDSPTIADVALYAYVARAPEGNVSLADYPTLRAWLARIEALPGFVPMARTPVGLNA